MQHNNSWLTILNYLGKLWVRAFYWSTNILVLLAKMKHIIICITFIFISFVKWEQKESFIVGRWQSPFSKNWACILCICSFLPRAAHTMDSSQCAVETRARVSGVPARAPIYVCALSHRSHTAAGVDKQSELWLPACMCGESLGVESAALAGEWETLSFCDSFPLAGCHLIARRLPSHSQVQKSQQVGTSLGTESNWRQFLSESCAHFSSLLFSNRFLARTFIKMTQMRDAAKIVFSNF